MSKPLLFASLVLTLLVSSSLVSSSDTCDLPFRPHVSPTLRPLKATTATWAASQHLNVPFPDILNSSQYSLQAVQIVFRHGERSPLDLTFKSQEFAVDGQELCSNGHVHSHEAEGQTVVEDGKDHRYPEFSLIVGDNQETDDPRVWSHSSGNARCYPGQLTNRGKNSMFRLGKKLRQRYIDELGLVDDSLSPSQAGVKVLSTRVSRTIESVMNLLRGMFPRWVEAGGSEAAHQKLPIQLRSKTDEFLLPSLRNCPRLAGLWSKKSVQAADTHRRQAEAIMKKLQGLVAPIEGKEVEGLAAQDFYDLLACYEVHGVPLPTQVDEATFGEVARIFAELWWRFVEGDDEMCRLGSGRLLQEFYDVFSAPKAKLTLYSAHDSTLAFLLSSLNLSNRSWPPCSSQMILELYEGAHPQGAAAAAEKEKYVRMVYNNEVLTIPGCVQEGDPTLCPLENFRLLTQKLVPDNLAQECAA